MVLVPAHVPLVAPVLPLDAWDHGLRAVLDDRLPQAPPLPVLPGLGLLLRARRGVVGPEEEGRVVNALGRLRDLGRRLRLPVAPGPPQHRQELGHLGLIGNGEAGRIHDLPGVVGHPVVPRAGEEDEAVPLALELIHPMPALPVEESEAVGDVKLDAPLGHRLLEDLELDGAVVLCEVVQLTALEVPECLQTRRANVAAVAVEPPRVVLVDVDGREDKVGTEVVGGVVAQPPAEELAELRVAPRLLLCDDVPRAVRDEAHGVTVDERLPGLHDVLARHVLPEVPQAQHAEDLEVRELARLRLQQLQDLLGLLVGQRAPGHHERGLPEPGAVCEAVHLLDLQHAGYLNLAKAAHVGPLLPDALL
mmetsp:Transcript_26179/g.83041  ORF Transcript_26179/g.83041 Transcript_26179/m.83041 type:complete len:363 (+) Transcript_26179:1041-2129(+)